jgi:hypothetical protein
MRRFFGITRVPFGGDARGNHGEDFDQHFFHYVFSCISFPYGNGEFVMQWKRIARLAGVYYYQYGGIADVSLKYRASVS